MQLCNPLDDARILNRPLELPDQLGRTTTLITNLTTTNPTTIDTHSINVTPARTSIASTNITITPNTTPNRIIIHLITILIRRG